MSKNFYLFLPLNNSDLQLESAVLSWVYEDDHNQLQMTKGSLSDAVISAADHFITIVMPGEDVLFLQAEVPGKNIQRVQQAVPYVLEDSVIDDVDDLYFAISKPNTAPDNQYDISVINSDYFESVIKQLETVGIYADVMTADYFLNENNILLFDGERIVFNSDKLKFSSDINGLKNISKDVLDGAKLVDCSGEKQGEGSFENKLKDFNLDVLNCNDASLVYLIKNCSNHPSVNLLQGTYKKKKDWSSTSKKWLPAAALFLVWLIVQGGVFVFDYIDLNDKNKRLNLEITNIYKQSFPQSRRIIDAKAQMKQKLDQLRKRKGKSGRSFTNMLSASARVFSVSKGLIIKSLRYYDGRIDLEVQIASLQALDKLKEQLQKENGYQVEVQNASSGKETVTARLQIIGAAL